MSNSLLKELLQPLSPEDASSLCSQISMEEIKNAIFCIGNEKSLSPDG